MRRAAALQAEFDAEAAAEGVGRRRRRGTAAVAGLSPLEAMRNAVRRLMLRGDEAYIDGTSDEALELLTALALTLTHGHKQKAPAAGVAAIAELWAAGPPTLWSVVLALEKFHEPARKTVGFVKSCGGVADGDKGGLWLRMVLNEGCLHSMLRVLLQELPNKERFYDDDAFARSEQWVDVLLSLTAVLDQIVFQFAPPTPPVQPAAPPARALPERHRGRGRLGGRRRARRRRALAARRRCGRRRRPRSPNSRSWRTARGRRPRWRSSPTLPPAAGRAAAGRRAAAAPGAPSAGLGSVRRGRRSPARRRRRRHRRGRRRHRRGHRRRRRRHRCPPRGRRRADSVGRDRPSGARALAGASAITSGWGGVGVARRAVGGAGCIRRRCV